MRKLPLLAIIYAALFYGCKQAGASKENISNSTAKHASSNSLLALKSKFLFHHLTNFKMESFEIDKRLVEMDSTVYNTLFGIDKDYPYNQHYYYSWQTKVSDLIEFTILTVDEKNSGNVIEYCIFNQQQKLRSRFTVAARCMDAEWSYIANSETLNNHTIERLIMNEDAEDYSDTIIHTDSLIHRIIIAPSGNTTEKLLYQSKRRKN